MAGYPGQHEIHPEQPRLESRFPTTIAFTDFSDRRCCQILQRMCQSGDYTLAAGSEIEGAVSLLEAQTAEPDFANARTVRNLFEAAVAPARGGFAIWNRPRWNNCGR